MKKDLFILIILLSSALIFAGGKKEISDEINFVCPAGFTAVSLAEFITGNITVSDEIKITYEVLQSSDLLSAKILSGEADMFIAPSNLGANLYNKGIDISYAGSMIWGILYIVTTEDISDWKDLKGKEISMFGRGLTPDIITRHLLETNGLDPEKDVKLKYVQNTTELAPAFISGKTTISMMPEPALTMVKTKQPATRVMIDLQKEWAEISGTSESYPQASLYIKGELAKKYPEIIDSFISKYAESIKNINTDPESAGIKAASFLPAPPAKIIEKSIPGGNLRWVNSSDARKSMEEYLDVIIQFNPESIGGSLPDEQFYYKGR